MSYLNSGRINTWAIKEILKRDILDILDHLNGPKIIIWDENVIASISLIIEYQILKDNDVIHMYSLKEQSVPMESAKHIIFIIKPDLNNINSLYFFINSFQKKNFNHKELHLLWVPKNFVLYDEKLKELDLYTIFTSIGNLGADLFPFDSDLISMEILGVYKDLILEYDPFSLYLSGRALNKLLKIHPLLCNTKPKIISKGVAAKKVHELLKDPNFQDANEKINKAFQETLSLSNDLSSKPYSSSASYSSPNTTTLIILDRSVDLLTPLLTQLTYEGLIDEIFGIKGTYLTRVMLPLSRCLLKYFKASQSTKNNQASTSTNPFSDSVDEDDQQIPEGGGIGDSNFANTESENNKAIKTLSLNSRDEIFGETRDKNFNAVGSYLSIKAKNLASQFEERHNVKTVSEVKGFVSKLPYLQNIRSHLTNHTTIAEVIKERIDSDEFRDILKAEQEFLFCVGTDKINTYIEDCIARKESLTKVLRLLCAQSFVNNGLKTKVLEQYSRDIFQTYGYVHMLTLNNLKECKMLVNYIPDSTNKRPFSALVKSYNLIVEKTDEKLPHDFSYVYSIYAPLSVRIVQKILSTNFKETHIANKGMSQKNSSFASLNIEYNKNPFFLEEDNKSINHSSIPDSGSVRSGSVDNNSLDLNESSSYQQNTIIVFMIGGLTLAEISALRFLLKSEESSYDYLIITTEIINGKTWIDYMYEHYL
ncbi:vacuolar protein sorting-associated protein 33A-like [Gordionus sp. m RMFG-2023]|uniref:vacuolar protein sorting-associated protein 33A-like n=1 Tax=Gordionus sp. m RMFG-2023 TaxID=3053472 RepID=UPI0031FBE843